MANPKTTSPPYRSASSEVANKVPRLTTWSHHPSLPDCMDILSSVDPTAGHRAFPTANDTQTSLTTTRLRNQALRTSASFYTPFPVPHPVHYQPQRCREHHRDVHAQLHPVEPPS